jgi:hypothetical protein
MTNWKLAANELIALQVIVFRVILQALGVALYDPVWVF